jgi:hypothetical protein
LIAEGYCERVGWKKESTFSSFPLPCCFLIIIESTIDQRCSRCRGTPHNNNNNSIQLIDYRANLTARRPFIKRAREEKRNKNTHIQNTKQGHFDDKIMIMMIIIIIIVIIIIIIPITQE